MKYPSLSTHLCLLEASCFIVHLKCLFLTQTSLMPLGGINFDMPYIFIPYYASTGDALQTHFCQIPKGLEFEFSAEAKLLTNITVK